VVRRSFPIPEVVMSDPKRFTIGAASAQAFDMSEGSTLKITDPEGSQVGDLMFYVKAQPKERFSQGRTRQYLGRVKLRVGDPLISTLDRPLLTILEDTVGVHDLLYPSCNEYVYAVQLASSPRPGCQGSLEDALARFDIVPGPVIEPFNVCMASAVNADGSLVIETSPSQPGDFVSFRAETGLIVALSACADDVTSCNGGKCTPLEVEITSP
jgi:uncharacterized protein